MAPLEDRLAPVLRGFFSSGWNNHMSILQFRPPARQGIQPHPKRGIAGLYFTAMSPERQAQRIRELRAAAMPEWLIVHLVRR
jgi:hypothetical protein